jgi:fatty acid desaturase
MTGDPRAARLLGLWTAACLAVLLVAGLLWLGDLSLQWPVLVVPVLWALVALRPRRRGAAWEVVERPGRRSDPQSGPHAHGERTDTVERPTVRRDGRTP